MKLLSYITPCLFALLVAAGCASTKVTKQQSQIGTEKLPRPEHIYVYPFAATPADIPSWSNAAGRYAPPSTPPTEKELEAGRKLGALVAKELVTEIQEMALPALERSNQTAPQVNDILIMGYFQSVEEGKAGRRMVLGFGSGSAELKTAVDGYQMTPQGLRQLGSGELKAGGGKKPGLAAPLVVFAATANPIGLIVGGTAKMAGEVTGKDTIEGAAKRTAKEIAERLEVRFKEQSWIR